MPAPEILATGRAGKESDIWALGIVLFFLLVGTNVMDAIPTDNKIGDVVGKIKEFASWSAEKREQEILAILRQIYPKASRYTSVACDLLVKLLDPDPERRPEATDILEHEFFQESCCSDEAPDTPAEASLTDESGPAADPTYGVESALSDRASSSDAAEELEIIEGTQQLNVNDT